MQECHHSTRTSSCQILSDNPTNVPAASGLDPGLLRRPSCHHKGKLLSKSFSLWHHINITKPLLTDDAPGLRAPLSPKDKYLLHFFPLLVNHGLLSISSLLVIEAFNISHHLARQVAFFSRIFFFKKG